jgi:hypothetical protein
VPLPKIEREEMRFLTPAEVATTLADAIDPLSVGTEPTWIRGSNAPSAAAAPI